MTSPLFFTPRSLSCDSRRRVRERSLSFEQMPAKIRRKSTKASFSIDNELTSIPKEYSNLFRKEGEKATSSGEDECLGCSQVGSSRSHCKSCPPFVKTMEQVIENRTSYMLTK